jgi:hypothetical protein
VSRCAAAFAFTAHGLARELHQNNARNQKPSSIPRGLIISRLLRSQSVASAVGTHRARPDAQPQSSRERRSVRSWLSTPPILLTESRII